MKINLGIVGIGNIGSSVIEAIEKNKRLYKKKYDLEINIIGISGKNKKKKRSFKLSRYIWFSNPLEMTNNKEINIIVELVGGVSGLPLELARKSLKQGKNFVTANKAMMAVHGKHLCHLATQNGVNINYEASVAGGIPLIRTIQNSLLAGNIKNIYGILNGTCNYILTQMREKKITFKAALNEAQNNGFAESNPFDDISGQDTAYKLNILSSLAYAREFKVKDIHIEGISNIDEIDLKMADNLGYILLLLGISNLKSDIILQRVHPCLISKESILSKVTNEINTVILEDDMAGKIMVVGKGAGKLPTTSSVITDILNLKETKKRFLNYYEKKILPKPLRIGEISERKGKFYIRILVKDKPGVLADITGFFKKQKVSISSMFQLESKNKKTVPLIFITHFIKEKEINLAVKKIEKIDKVIKKATIIRIENI